MNKNKKIYLYCLYICTVVINVSTLLGGIKHHETWRIVVGSISLALIIIAIGLTVLGYKRNKVTQFPD
ncbi:hypothetical protein KXD93_07305 [Mucilaginibacter sp. BJC16-A38]|uniref:hypothetical protein n=1 Tax=Mucilaginibacter phenanthrenivorans TaxID=1234842 RepID=UPI0021576432|nr:hypothetical protein [Mucilaginibacter phenanthrenivorans]MCR8557441.1 hypothetical protein [Mucilaginibacter phenanthrenivorans]